MLAPCEGLKPIKWVVLRTSSGFRIWRLRFTIDFTPFGQTVCILRDPLRIERAIIASAATSAFRSLGYTEGGVRV
jgi:hypothetical protein